MKRDPLPPTILTLTVVSGMIDAISYLALGHIFISVMTGNIVVLGFALGGAPGFTIDRTLLAIGSLLVGVIAGGHLERNLRHWVFWALCTETGMLALAVVLAVTEPAHPYLLIMVLALSMGIRNVTVRRLGVPELSTSVALTATITALITESPLVGREAQNAGRRVALVVALAGGATLGSWLVTSFGVAWSLAAATLPVTVLTVLAWGFTRRG